MDEAQGPAISHQGPRRGPSPSAIRHQPSVDAGGTAISHQTSARRVPYAAFGAGYKGMRYLPARPLHKTPIELMADGGEPIADPGWEMGRS